MMNYAQQIKHPKWQKKRLEVLKLHKFTCQVCGEKEEELHVHHPVYKRGAMIWEYDKGELECLCHRCHKDAHAIDEQIKKALASCKEKGKVLDFIKSLSCPNMTLDLDPPVQNKKLSPLQQMIAQRKADEETERIEAEKELAEFYALNPDLMPVDGETKEERSQRFFDKIRLMVG